jgi:mannan endo-1,4-beta-mannosidase
MIVETHAATIGETRRVCEDSFKPPSGFFGRLRGMKLRLTRLSVILLTANLLLLGLAGCANLWRDRFDLFADQAPPPVFHVQGDVLLTPDGRPFIARGINLQYGDRPKAAYPALGVLHDQGANIIRLELRADTSAHDLRRALNRAVRLKTPVMVMLWEKDVTCRHDSAVLRHYAQDLWRGRWSQVLLARKYQPYLMLNIANEWGSSNNGFRDYLATYRELIGALRARGFRMPLVIDAADCGQNPASFTDGRGATLEAADPLHNTIFSVHAYNRPWADHVKIDANLAALQATGLPFLLGEFGSRQLVEDGAAVDHLYLMQRAQAMGIGWIAWSWKGNGGPSQVLDMSKRYGRAELTQHGQDVINGPDGIRATAKAAF